jgi:WD40 repeat protein
MMTLTSRIPVLDRMAFSPDGLRLYACGSMVPDLRFKPFNHGIDVWQIGGGAGPARHYFDGGLTADFALSPCGRWVYAAFANDAYDARRCCHSLDTTDTDGAPLEGSEGGMSLCAGNGWVIGLNAEWRPYRLHLVRWEQTPGAHPNLAWSVPATAGRRKWVHELTAHPDGRLVVGHQYDVGVAVQDSVHELAVFNASDGRRITTVPAVSKQISRLAFSPDGGRLVALAGRTILIWTAADWSAKPRKVTGARSHFTSLAFHPSGRFLAATSNDATVRLYDTSNWALATTYTWDIGRMRSVAFSPDGLLAAAGSDTSRVVVWDVDV